MLLSSSEGSRLCRYARGVIAARFGAPDPVRPSNGAFEELAATFVTLERGDMLHGCMGTLEPKRPLVDDVAHNAFSAAFRDPRAVELHPGDEEHFTVSVTLLGPIVEMNERDEASVLAALRPSIDGVVFSSRGRRSTFLPQVWDSLPEPHRFLAALKQKAGFALVYWSDDVRISRYQVQSFEDLPMLPSSSDAHV